MVLHYFDNLPTAAVATRAGRLRDYLAKRMVRGEIRESDRIALIGHSTGGLDIRQLVLDLNAGRDRSCLVDGVRYPGLDSQLRRSLKTAVFLSVPHWGTNIADWVRRRGGLRKLLLWELQAAVSGSQVSPLDAVEAGLSEAGAALAGADLLLAWKDALTEASDHYGTPPGAARTADALEAHAGLSLYLRLMAHDFHAIDDLASQPGGSTAPTPAHLDPAARARELKLWSKPAIRTLTFATVGCRPYRFPSGLPVPAWDFAHPGPAPDFPLLADPSYCLCYRACAGGPFRRPSGIGDVTEILEPAPALPLEVWDNDGVVNTLSMLWPGGHWKDMVLVPADHLDIVGHYRLQPLPGASRREGGPPARRYKSYDALKSSPRFTRRQFEAIWLRIFDFCAAA